MTGIGWVGPVILAGVVLAFAISVLQARTNGVPIVAIYMELKDSPVGWM